MQTRISYGKVAHEGIKAMAALEQYLRTCGLEKSLLDLVMLRASQVNGCAVCLDAHWKELRGAGENDDNDKACLRSAHRKGWGTHPC